MYVVYIHKCAVLCVYMGMVCVCTAVLCVCIGVECVQGGKPRAVQLTLHLEEREDGGR